MEYNVKEAYKLLVGREASANNEMWSLDTETTSGSEGPMLYMESLPQEIVDDNRIV